MLLLFLIVGYQGFALVEKLWLKTWGEAYEMHNASSLYTHPLAAAYHLGHHSAEENLGDQHILAHSAVSVAPTLFGNSSVHSDLEWRLPSANTNPYFYVGVYAGIVFAAAIMATVNSTVQVSGRFCIRPG